MENNHVSENTLTSTLAGITCQHHVEDQGLRSHLESEVAYGIAYNRWFRIYDWLGGDQPDLFLSLGNRFPLRDRQPRIEEVTLEGDRFHVMSYGANNEAA